MATYNKRITYKDANGNIIGIHANSKHRTIYAAEIHCEEFQPVFDNQVEALQTTIKALWSMDKSIDEILAAAYYLLGSFGYQLEDVKEW